MEIFGKIEDNCCPEHLQSLLPQKVGEPHPMSRCPDDFKILKCRTETKSYFFYNLSMEWPSYLMNLIMRHILMNNWNLSQFNFLMKEIIWSNNVKRAQLRMNCSKLNAHLFQLCVTDTIIAMSLWLWCIG